MLHLPTWSKVGATVHVHTALAGCYPAIIYKSEELGIKHKQPLSACLTIKLQSSASSAGCPCEPLVRLII